MCPKRSRPDLTPPGDMTHPATTIVHMLNAALAALHKHNHRQDNATEGDADATRVVMIVALPLEARCFADLLAAISSAYPDAIIEQTEHQSDFVVVSTRNPA